MECKIKVEQKNHAFCGLERMNRFRTDHRFCDFIIKVGSAELPVHKNVICAHSDYFDAMTLHDTTERQTGFVEIRGVNPKCAINCVNFMYTGETSFAYDDIEDMMYVATMFQLPTLCDALADKLASRLDCETFFYLKKFGDFYDSSKLVNACNAFSLRHFQEISHADEFKELDEEFVSFLVGSQNAQVTEGFKCRTILEWVRHDVSNRKVFLQDLIAKLDMAKIPLSYRSFLTEHEPIIITSRDCLKILAMSIIRSVRVTLEEKEIAVFHKANRALQAFDLETKTWRQKQTLSNEMLSNEFSAIVSEQHLYVFTTSQKVHRIIHSDPEATWEEMANKALPFYGPAVYLNGFIYTIAYVNYCSQIERYDLALNRWDLLPRKHTEVAGAVLAAAEEKIFSIGGCDNLGMKQNVVEIFDPDDSAWNFGSQLIHARYYASSTTHGNSIYVMGGCNQDGLVTSDVEYRCPQLRVWISLQAMKIPRQHFCSCCIGGKIFAIGGDDSNMKTIEEYDPARDEWRVIERMEGRNIMSLASISLPK